MRDSSNLTLVPRVWWLNPIVAFSVPAVLAGYVAYVTGANDYWNLWRTQKYFDLTSLETLLAAVVAFACGCVFGMTRRAGAPAAPALEWTKAIRWDVVARVFNICFFLTVAAYLLWIAVAVKAGLNLQSILGLINGKDTTGLDLGSDHLPTIPGVTTATQFGLTVIALAVPLASVRGWRTVRWQCAIVFALALVRSFVNSERLALIELIVPFIVSFVWFLPQSKGGQLLTRWAPVGGAVLLFFGFSGAEYFRSWSFYSTRVSNFWLFMSLRLAGYYATALNNGALMWKLHAPLSLGPPYETLAFLWRFPVVQNLLPVLWPGLAVRATDAVSLRYMDILKTNANPEFNNASGIFPPVSDFGVMGGLFYWCVCGVICGFIYREFRLRRPIGVFLYPSLFISLIEATRILYWASTRFFPHIVVMILGVLFLFRRPASPLLVPLRSQPVRSSLPAAE